MNWPVFRLDDVSEIVAGNPAPQASADFADDGFPFVRMQDVGREHHTSNLRYSNDKVSSDAVSRYRLRLFPAGSVLIPKSGASVNLNHRAMLGNDAYVVSHLAVVIPNREKLLPEYLYFWSLAYDPRNQAQTTSLPSLPLSLIKAAPIAIPPIVEQRRIIDILSRAEGIVRLRREAQKKAIEIIPAMFLDMFGNPATNPKGWPMRKVSDFVARFEGGKNIQAGSENGSAYRILKVSAVTSGIYRESESKPAPDGYIPPSSHIIRVGDMLFSRANTKELVGATAIVEQTNEKTLLPDKLWRFVWAEPVEPAYMHALFQSAHVRRELGKLSSGTSASMLNISQGKLFNFTLPVAPYAEQHRFAERSATICSIKTQQIDATAKAKATFNALLAHPFSEQEH